MSLREYPAEYWKAGKSTSTVSQEKTNKVAIITRIVVIGQ
jgi:hypothetical protein